MIDKPTRIETLTDQSFQLTQRVKSLEIACIFLSVSVIFLCAIAVKDSMKNA